MYAKFYQNIHIVKEKRASFTFFRIWTAANSRPTINDIWQSLGLDLVNINVLAKVHQNKACSQSLDRWQIAFGNLFWLDLVNINVYAKFYQSISTVQKLGPVSFLFRILTSAKPRPNCIKNDNWLNLWLEFLNINVYAKFSRNILKSFKS